MTVYPKILGEAGSAWCLVFEGSAQEATGRAYGWSEAGLTVRMLRGRKMRHYHGLFDEFGAALQFPWYFGENGNAFDECVTDLSWLPSRTGYVFVITDAAEVLVDTNDDGLSWLVRSLSDAAAEWAKSVEPGETWDRPAVPFHVVLQVGKVDMNLVRARWATAGAETALVE